MELVVVALVLLAGAAGASIRFLVSLSHETYGAEPHEWPLGTLLVNMVASFAVGLLVTRDGNASTALSVGGLAALSTWSTVALELKIRVDAGHLGSAAGYLAASLAVGIGAAWLALLIT